METTNQKTDVEKNSENVIDSTSNQNLFLIAHTYTHSQPKPKRKSLFSAEIKNNPKRINRSSKYDGLKKEELFTDLLEKSINEFSQFKTLQEQKLNMKNNKSREKKLIYNQKNQKADFLSEYELLGEELLNLKKEKGKLKLAMRKIEVINPHFAFQTIKSHPFLDKEQSKPKTKNFDMKESIENPEITFKLKSRMVEFIKKLRKQVPVDFELEEEKLHESRFSKSNRKVKNITATPKKNTLELEKSALKKGESQLIDQLQSNIDDLIMKEFEKEDEIEMLENKLKGLDLKENKILSQISKTKQKLEKDNSQNDCLENVAFEEKSLKEKENDIKLKIEKSLQNPLLQSKIEVNEKKEIFSELSKKLIKLKSENEKLFFFQKEKTNERKSIDEENKRLFEEKKQKEAKIQELALHNEIKNNSSDMDVFFQTITPSAKSDLNSIYEDLLSVLKKSSALKSQIEKDSTENQNLKITIEKNELEKLNLRAILSSLSDRLIDCGIELENVSSTYQSELTSLISKCENQQNKFRMRRSFIFYVWISGLPNNLNPIIDCLSPKSQLSFLNKVEKNSLHKKVINDLEIIPDKITIKIRNLIFFKEHFLDSKTFGSLKLMINFNKIDALIYSNLPFKFQTLNFEHEFRVELITKADFLKFVMDEVQLKIQIYIEGKEEIIGGSKINTKKFFEESLSKIVKNKSDFSSEKKDCENAAFSDFDQKNFLKSEFVCRMNKSEMISTAMLSDKEANDHNKIGTFDYSICLDSSNSLQFNNTMIQTISQKQIEKLTLKVFSGFDLNKQSKYSLRILTDPTKISNFSANCEINVKEVNSNLVELTTLKMISGPNPFFDFMLKFDILFENKIEPFPIEIALLEFVSSDSGLNHIFHQLSLNVNHLYVHEKFCKIKTFKNAKTKNSKASLLLAIFNENHCFNDLQILDNIYSKTWFVNCVEKVTKVIKFKHSQKEIILQNVFSETKSSISVAEFLRNTMNTSTSEIQNSKLKCVINHLGETMTIFQNMIEFRIFWRFLILAQTNFNPNQRFEKSKNIPKDDDSKSTCANETPIEQELISYVFFKYIFLELDSHGKKEQENQKVFNFKQNDEITEVIPIKSDSEAIQKVEQVDKKQTLSGMILEFQTSLRKYQALNKLNLSELVFEFDARKDEQIRKDDFIKFVQKVSLNLIEENIVSIFNILDKKSDDFVKPYCLIKIFELDPHDLLKYSTNDDFYEQRYIEFKKQKLLSEYMSKSYHALQKFEYSFLKLLDKTNIFNAKEQKVMFLDKQMFIAISKNVLQVEGFTDNDFELIFSTMDIKEDKKISFEEFCTFMKFDKIFKMTFECEPKHILEANEFLKASYTYSCEKKVNLEKIFEKIDLSENGFVSKIDLYIFYKNFDAKVKLNITIDHLDEFIALTDLHQKSKISFRELLHLLDSYEAFRKKPNEINHELREKLILKLYETIKSEDFRLRICFECEEEEQNIVSIDKFVEILKENCNFTQTELEMIVNPIALPFTKFERVNYTNFLKFGDFYNSEIQKTQIYKNDCSTEIAKILKEIAKKHNYDKFLLFSLFDSKNDGKLFFENFDKVFKEMKISFNSESLSSSILSTGKKNSGSINLREFCELFERN